MEEMRGSESSQTEDIVDLKGKITYIVQKWFKERRGVCLLLALAWEQHPPKKTILSSFLAQYESYSAEAEQKLLLLLVYLKTLCL